MTAAAASADLDLETTPMPRLALYISEPVRLMEVEQLLAPHYDSLMVVGEKAKFGEFRMPLIILVDCVRDVPAIRELHPVKGTRILVILGEGDSEEMGAAFDAGVDDYIPHPFTEKTVVEKIEKYLQAFREAV